MAVYVGMRNWHPFITDTVERMLADGVKRARVVCMAPQNSRTSVGLYKKAVLASASDRLQLSFVESWHANGHLIEAFAENLRAARTADQAVIFTAHSVPARTIEEGDPYEAQARETARLVAESVGLRDTDWVFAFQSQGQSGGPWIGPTVEETIDALAAEGKTTLLLQPVGFLCDHVEVLYDIDRAFVTHARSRGVTLTRTESLNVSPRLIVALASIVHATVPHHATV
jgi:ferrochelatase